MQTFSRCVGAVGFVAAVALAGCTSTGGTIGGLVPAPKFLNGTVAGDVYSPPDRSFEVQIPYPPSRDAYQWSYAKVSEGADGPNTTWVIFGPAATDLAEYHAVLIKAPVLESLDKQATLVFDNRTRAFSTQTGEATTQVHRESFRLSEHPAVYAVFENRRGYVVEVVVDFGPNFAHLEALVPRNVPGSKYDGELRTSMLSRKWTRFNEFIESFKVSR